MKTLRAVWFNVRFWVVVVACWLSILPAGYSIARDARRKQQGGR